jgi:hypothetical protein
VVIFVLALLSSAYSRVPAAEPFSTDLPRPYDQLLEAVRGVIENGAIRGTFQYQGTNELSGANPENTSRAFAPWKAPGVVLYKVRTGALAPAHFLDSNDVGTVTVRYVVQKLSPQMTRLRIEAIFDEDTHHHHHPSDGSVEVGEFAAINDWLKKLDQQAKETKEAVARQEAEHKVKDLQNALATERSRLDAATAEVQQLQERARELRRKVAARVATPNAELKSAPFTHASTIKLLSREQPVTILTWTPYWCHVRLTSGQEGWIYHLFLEALP